MAPSVFNKMAHSSYTPKIVSNAIDDSPLQAWISAEKAVLASTKQLALETQKSAEGMEGWAKAQMEGGGSSSTLPADDLNDVCGKLGRLTGSISTAFMEFLQHGEEFRTHLKHVRTREERLLELKKKRDSIYRAADSTEKRAQKLADKPEHKDLESTRAKLNGLRQEAQSLDRIILNEESQLAAFKRQTIRNAGSVKLAAYLQVAQKMTIVAELGKLMLQELDGTVVPPGQKAPRYDGHETVENLYAEARRCLSEVRFEPQVGAPASIDGTGTGAGAGGASVSRTQPTFDDPNLDSYENEPIEGARNGGHQDWAGEYANEDDYYDQEDSRYGSREGGSDVNAHPPPMQAGQRNMLAAGFGTDGVSGGAPAHDMHETEVDRRLPNISKEELVSPTEEERMGDLRSRESTFPQSNHGRSAPYHSLAPSAPPQDLGGHAPSSTPYSGSHYADPNESYGQQTTSRDHQPVSRYGVPSSSAAGALGGRGDRSQYDRYAEDQYNDYRSEPPANAEEPGLGRTSYPASLEEDRYDHSRAKSSDSGRSAGAGSGIQQASKKRLPQPPPPLPSSRPGQVHTGPPSAAATSLSLANPDDLDDDEYDQYGQSRGQGQGGYQYQSQASHSAQASPHNAAHYPRPSSPPQLPSIRPVNVNGGAPAPSSATANAASAILQGGYSSGRFATDLSGDGKRRR